MTTITEDYCSRDIYRLLREKGFDGEIHTTFDKDGYTQASITLQMAMKWLLREYRLYMNVVPSVEGYYWTEKWHSYVEDLNKRYPYGKFIGTFNSPEAACEAAIKYCLQNLI